MKKGYYGIGIYETKETDNVGTLWRSVMNFGADYIFIIGARYKKQRSDTTKTWRNIPLFAYKDWEDFIEHIPKDAEGCRSICEIQNNALQASHGSFRINYFVAIEKSRTQDQNRI